MQKKITYLLLFIALISSALSQEQLPSDSLILYLPFNNNSNDESGKENNGIIHGATLTKDRNGVDNGALLFDGIDDYIEIETMGDTLFYNDFSISILCKFADFNKDYAHLISGENNFIALHANGPKYYDDAEKITVYQGPNYLPDNRRVPPLISKNTFVPDLFYNIVFVKKGDTASFFINGIRDTFVISNNYPLPKGNSLYIGTGFKKESYQCFRGTIDELAIYGRAINPLEINNIYKGYSCANTITNDTAIFYVSNSDFKELSPRFEFIKTDSLINKVGSCDSIVNRYAKYVFNPNYCTEPIYDTIYTSISVTDTLIINLKFTGIDSPKKNSVIKVYPNPAKDFVIINSTNVEQITNYSLKITNIMGQVLFEGLMNNPKLKVDIHNFGGPGTYLLSVYSADGNLKEIRKLLIK